MYKNCSECQKQFLYTTCSPQVWAWNFHLVNLLNNLLSYCELVDAKIRASDKDLPVISKENDSSLSDYNPKKDDSKKDNSKNNDSENNDSKNNDSKDNQESNTQNANNQEDSASRPVPITSLKFSEFPDRTILKL